MPAQSCLPGLQRAHVLFQAAGLVIKPFRCGLVRCLQCPGLIAGTLQLSNIRNLLRRHVMELARHRRQPRRRVSGQLPEGFSDLVHLHAGCRGETRHTLADGRNLSLTAYPALTSALSDSLVWLNVSPAACPALDRTSIRSAVRPD